MNVDGRSILSPIIPAPSPSSPTPQLLDLHIIMACLKWIDLRIIIWEDRRLSESLCVYINSKLIIAPHEHQNTKELAILFYYILLHSLLLDN